MERVQFPTDLQKAQQLGEVLSQYTQDHYGAVLLGHASVYIYLQTFAIPGTVFANLLGGALFGMYVTPVFSAPRPSLTLPPSRASLVGAGTLASPCACCTTPLAPSSCIGSAKCSGSGWCVSLCAVCVTPARRVCNAVACRIGVARCRWRASSPRAWWSFAS